MAQASRDENRVTTLLAVSNADGETPVTLYADPTTHRLLVSSGGGGSGDVVGPGSSTDNAVVRWNGATGIDVQNSGVIIDDSNNITGVAALTASGAIRSNTSLIVEETGAGTDTITLQAPASIAASYTLTLPVNDGDASQFLQTDGSGVLSWASGGTGDVTAASNLTDNAIVRGDGGAKGVQTSAVIIDDTDNVTGMATLTLPNTGLHLLDTNASHDLIVAPGSDLSADRTLTITTGDSDRTLTLAGNATISGTNTGDVTLAGTPDYITISGQVITRNAIDVAADITGVVPVANGGTNASSAGITAFNNITGYTAAGATGTTSTNLVFSTSPTLVTPTLGAATATSINGLTITSSTGTLTITNGKTLSISNTLTFAGTDGNTFTFPSGSDTVVTLAATQELDNKTLDSSVGKGTWTASGTWTLPAYTAGGDITLAENTGVVYDAALSADGKYSGMVRAGTAGTALAFGDLVYLQASDSRWELTDADAASTSGDVLIGMCVLAAAGDGSPTTILLQGFIRADTAFPTLTIGAPAYVSTTAGDIQVAQPSGTDDVIRRVGFAWTADELYFNPSNDYVTHT